MQSRPAWDRPERLRREATLTRALLAVSAIAATALLADLVLILSERLRASEFLPALEQVAFLAIVAALLYGNLAYQISRLGFLERRRSYRPAARALLERVYEETAPPSLAILVPAYKEEPAVVRRTLLSAALQEHPRRRVVLLLDDPPAPADPAAAAALTALRRLPREIDDLLDKPARHFDDALASLLTRRREEARDRIWETERLAGLCSEAASWFESEAANYPAFDHVDRFFVELSLLGPARAERARAARLRRAVALGEPLSELALLREHRRLASLFRVGIEVFERKRYENLSHEPNKAMNLNSYIGLLGGSFREVWRGGRLHLEPSAGDPADLYAADAEFLITLDADSVLAPDYALRLLAYARDPAHQRVAVVQTPYSAFPGAPGLLERVAGATTDVQYVIHQGFTRHGATYWVGANALLRSEALREIRSIRLERGHAVPVFIQDRTVIEDTESTIDLVAHGWTLHNLPDRLAWSATPPDFGSLIVQRRRWANGGLLILPKLLVTLARGPWSTARLVEGWLRVHYLISIASVNASLMALFLWPFEHSVRSLLLPLASLPYFVLYGRDLVRHRYPAGDLLRAYALNLLLLPVQLAGVANSLLQAATGRKARFVRTPKVPGRTPAPAAYHVALLALEVLLCAIVAVDLVQGRPIHASFVAANAVALGYALMRLVGLGQIAEDLRLARPERGAPARTPSLTRGSEFAALRRRNSSAPREDSRANPTRLRYPIAP
jgi:cellulose synthase/poly-beta-1,6-N-acetylglucosamine synthase-like glycosyltransferase